LVVISVVIYFPGVRQLLREGRDGNKHLPAPGICG